jgi:hypothetical protein
VQAALPFWERAETVLWTPDRAAPLKRTSDAPNVTSRQIIP